MQMKHALVGLLALSACWTGSAPAGRALPDCPGEAFDRQAKVFDLLTICATEGVGEDKLRHAAAVAAEWLDNDSDGAVDEPRLVPAMAQSRPFLIMTPEGPSEALIDAIGDVLDSRVGQDLGASETAPGHGQRDAAQEEIHHLVLNAGWIRAFPKLFADTPGSVLYGQWQEAEAQGNYAYDDPTCDASCKVTEFFYLATAAYLGSPADLASDEMRLKDRAALTAALPGTVALIEAGDYAYPRDHWPTGRYAHPERIVLTPSEAAE